MQESQTAAAEWNFWKQWETIRLETNAASPEIGLMTLNRPDKLNAVNLAMMQDLHACLDFLNHAFDCRVVILRGAGRIFCAGADLTSSPAGDAGYDWAKFPDKVKSFWQMQHELSSAILKFRRIPQPVLAAVHGAAVGAGLLQRQRHRDRNQGSQVRKRLYQDRGKRSRLRLLVLPAPNGRVPPQR